MLAEVDSAGMATLLPRTGFLHTKGAFVFYQDDDLNCFFQNCQMLAFKAMFFKVMNCNLFLAVCK